jgi:hypothetical protein
MSDAIIAAFLWPVYDVPVLFRGGVVTTRKVAAIAELGVALAFPVFNFPFFKNRTFLKEIGETAFGYLVAVAISFASRMM